MYKIYGSEMCPDCVECKYNFDYYKIEYEFIDITSSLSNLKEFLRLRDSSSFYDKCKQKGLIGIPTLIDEQGNMTYYYKKIIEEKGFKFIPLEDIEKKSCSIDGGC